jgi:hypothetical protein
MEGLMDLILDAILDTVKTIPFLLLVYIFIEYLERNKQNKVYYTLLKTKKFQPIIGSFLGCIPQCGFSVVGANLYSQKLITMGTLIAIFLSTSDEAVPILLASPQHAKMVVVLLILKVIIAIIVGVVVDCFIKSKVTKHSLVSIKMDSHKECCSCENESIFKSALIHTLKISAFLLIVTLALNFAIESIGEERLQSLLMTGSIFQPAIAAIIGLIPNCAASIILIEMYIAGTIGFGSAIAGLCTGAGIGALVLFKANKNFKENITIIAILYITSSIAGMIIQVFM